MSLQRRLLIYLLLFAPLVWAVALVLSVAQARHEVNELFDTQLIRLARQVQVMSAAQGWQSAPADPPDMRLVLGGEADLADLAIAIWNRDGLPMLLDREGAQLPYRVDGSGFEDTNVQGTAWRIYYLQAPDGGHLVAAGQLLHERDELVWGLVGSQLLPWLLVLPVLLAALAWGVRVGLAPVRELADELSTRRADDLRTVSLEAAPAELRPMLNAMNGLFGRIEDTLARERRFTADAAHELRTPVSVLAAQWAVYRRAHDGVERDRAAQALDAGLARMARLIEQMLGLSRLDATERLKAPQPLDWPPLIEEVMSGALPLAERRHIELACEWAERGAPAPAWSGDAHLMALLLRNLLDNAVRYAPEGSTVTVRFDATTLSVENTVPADFDASDIATWGERFKRPDGQAENGSGLGVSIAQRIAQLHGLALSHRFDATSRRVVVELSAR